MCIILPVPVFNCSKEPIIFSNILFGTFIDSSTNYIIKHILNISINICITKLSLDCFNSCIFDCIQPVCCIIIVIICCVAPVFTSSAAVYCTCVVIISLTCIAEDNRFIKSFYYRCFNFFTVQTCRSNFVEFYESSIDN